MDLQCKSLHRKKESRVRDCLAIRKLSGFGLFSPCSREKGLWKGSGHSSCIHLQQDAHHSTSLPLNGKNTIVK